jgi:hypothetical protein
VTEDSKRPYRVEIQGTSLVIKCEVFGAALREARTLADRMQTDVKIYKGSQLMATVESKARRMDSER